MQNPKITIITATYNLIKYNRKDTFIQCVESVIAQNYTNYEHIVIDNASDDGTIELLNEYQNKGFITYYSEKDTGIYNAYNKGIMKAAGKYIAFLNSDDFYKRNDTLAVIAEKMESNNADFTYANVDYLNEDGSLLYNKKPNWENWFVSIPFCHSSMFAKKSLFESLNYFNEKYRIAADYDLIYKSILHKFKPVFIEEDFAVFRLGGISSSQEQELQLRKEYFDIIQTNCNLSSEETSLVIDSRYLPQTLLEQCTTLPDYELLLAENKKRYFKYLKRKLFTIRFSKKRKTIRILGFTLYNKEN